MKKRIFAGLLLALMLVVWAVPCSAEPAPEAPAEAVPTEEAAPEEAPTDEAAPEEAPVEAAPAPEIPEFGTSNSFTLEEAVYDNEAKTITFTIKNNTNDTQGIPWVAVEFDSAKMEVTPDYQTLFDESIAPQAGIQMEDGIIILIQKAIEPGNEQKVIFDATIADYKADALPQVKLSVYVQSISNVLDLTAAAAGNQNDLTIQRFDNILAVGASGGAVLSFIKDNMMNIAVILLWLVVLAMIIVMIISKSNCKKAVTEEVSEEAVEEAVEETFEDEEIESEENVEEDTEEGDTEDEEL